MSLSFLIFYAVTEITQGCEKIKKIFKLQSSHLKVVLERTSHRAMEI